jgi:uncharacterized membrane protein YgdD (TMEM256/DUF423 family)
MAFRRGWLATAAVNGLLAVAAGAFGAHGLAALPERYLSAFKTGAAYQMYHALALLAVALLPASRATSAAGWGFLLGVVVFSGSLYVLALTGVGVWGAITPIGGVLLLVGWAGLALAGLAGRRQP